jgi:hypothetical protein
MIRRPALTVPLLIAEVQGYLDEKLSADRIVLKLCTDHGGQVLPSSRNYLVAKRNEAITALWLNGASFAYLLAKFNLGWRQLRRVLGAELLRRREAERMSTNLEEKAVQKQHVGIL